MPVSKNINLKAPIATRTVVQMEKMPSVLSDDPKPTLAADLDATGKSLKNVNNLEAKTLNGVDVFSWVKTGLEELKKYCLSIFALQKHRHNLEDVSGVEDLVQKKLGAELSTYSLKGHSHRMQDIVDEVSLAKVQYGKELQSLLNKDLAAENHSHAEFSSIIPMERGGLGQDVSTGEGFVYLSNGHLELKEVEEPEVKQLDMTTLENRVTSYIQNQIKSIPEPEKEDPELMMELRFAQSLLVPTKCDGKRLQEVSCKTINGEAIDFPQALLNGAPFTVGMAVKTDDVLTLTPSQHCLVRLRFR